MSHFSNPFILHVDNLAVGYDRTIEAANYTKSTQLNPPITELTITTTTYPEKKNFQRRNFFTLDIVCPKFFFLKVVMVIIINGNCHIFDNESLYLYFNFILLSIYK